MGQAGQFSESGLIEANHAVNFAFFASYHMVRPQPIVRTTV
jgi:hypothetical protein